MDKSQRTMLTCWEPSYVQTCEQPESHLISGEYFEATRSYKTRQGTWTQRQQTRSMWRAWPLQSTEHNYQIDGCFFYSFVHHHHHQHDNSKGYFDLVGRQQVSREFRTKKQREVFTALYSSWWSSADDHWPWWQWWQWHDTCKWCVASRRWQLHEPDEQMLQSKFWMAGNSKGNQQEMYPCTSRCWNIRYYDNYVHHVHYLRVKFVIIPSWMHFCQLCCYSVVLPSQNHQHLDHHYRYH